MEKCQCPSCNAYLSIEDELDLAFCQYCGAKIMLDDYRSTHRIVDRARIAETETERLIRLKELEIEEKKRKSRGAAYKFAAVLSVIGMVLCLCGVFLGAIGIFAGAMIALYTLISGTDSQESSAEIARKRRSGMLQLPDTAVAYEGKDYRAVEAIYSSLGFRNIRLINLHDLRTNLTKKVGIVSAVEIDGEEPEEEEWYSKDAVVAITYHDYR